MAEKKFELKNIDGVTSFLKKKSDNGLLSVPADYDVSFALNTAYYLIQDEVKGTKANGYKPALELCTPASIQDALIKMVSFGLNPAKKQCYFIVAGNKLKILDSYFGDIAKAIRFGNLENEPVCNIVYEGDEFETNIDIETGYERLKKHNRGGCRDSKKITGAYALAKNRNGRYFFEFMTLEQIKRAWMKGNALMKIEGESGFQKQFTDRAVVRTVTRRLCYVIYNTSADMPEIRESQHEQTIDSDYEEIKQETISIPEQSKSEHVKIEAKKEVVKESIMSLDSGMSDFD